MLDRTRLSLPRLFTFFVALGMLACGGGPPAQSPDKQSPDDTRENTVDDSAAGEDGVPASEPGAMDSPVAAADGATDESAEEAASGGDFKRLDTHTAKDTHGVTTTKLKPTKTEALLKFVVVDKGKGKPIEGVVVSLTGEDDKKYYTEPTDAVGYADVLVPKGKKYEVVYLSLRGKDIAANLEVEDKERFTLKLTLRYQGYVGIPVGESAPALVLDGIQFDTGKAKIRPESFARLDGIVEYLTHKKNSRLEISGHTDNVGNKQSNKTLSAKRAEACRDYLISKGIDGGRLTAVGYGDERPIAPNTTAEGRQKNRRIEAVER